MVDHQRIASLLSIPVIPTITVHGQGVEHMVTAVQVARAPDLALRYDDVIEAALVALVPLLSVAPMVLGLGRVTMVTMTTRTLESKRERLLVILLLALAVPCSAQLGVVMGMLASISLVARLIWVGVVALILLVTGLLAARPVPGDRRALIVELPPLRCPQLTNILLKTVARLELKTVARLEWYVKEALPQRF